MADVRLLRIPCTIFILYLFIGISQSQSCVRDVDAARAEDSSRVCRKSCTDDSECDGELKRCVCDDDCGMSCFNPEALCPDIALTNGEITLSDGNRYNSVAAHECDQGYFFQGQKERKCRSTKTWSHSHNVPNCTRGCMVPRSPLGDSYITSGRLSGQVGYPVGNVVTYKCMTGFDAVGDPDRTCSGDYSWTNLLLLCTIKDCGAPDDIDHGSYNVDKTQFGGTVRYKCNTGYDINGQEVFRCQSKGVWEPEVDKPTCEPRSCIPPTKPENGDLTGGTTGTYSDIVDYTCDPGYVLNGPKRGSCNENGTWGEEPTCDVSIDTDFNSDHLDGYEVTAGSSWTRTQVDDHEDLPGYSLRGDGTVQSLASPMTGNARVCMQARVKDTKDNELKAKAYFDGKSKDLHTFTSTDVWKLEHFWFSPADPSQTQVRLQFVATEGSNVLLDDIEQVADSECAVIATSERTSTIAESHSTTRQTGTTTQQALTSYGMTQQGGGLASSGRENTSTQSTTRDGGVTTQSTLLMPKTSPKPDGDSNHITVTVKITVSVSSTIVVVAVIVVVVKKKKPGVFEVIVVKYRSASRVYSGNQENPTLENTVGLCQKSAPHTG